MQLIRGVLSFGASIEEMVHLWIMFCRSVLEQSCVVWHGSLTQENRDDLERTQKTFAKLMLKEKYLNYENALILLNLDSLETRRKTLNLKFAQAGIKNHKLNDLFPTNEKEHKMKTRKEKKYEVTHRESQAIVRIVVKIFSYMEICKHMNKSCKCIVRSNLIGKMEYELTHTFRLLFI